MVAETKPPAVPDARTPCAHRKRSARTFAGFLLSAALLTSPVSSTVGAAVTDEEPASATARESGKSSSLFHEAAGPLRLTPDQHARLEKISAESGEQAAIIRAELEAAREDLKTLLSVEEPDFTSVMAQVDRVGAVETRMHKHQIATLLALRAVLSSEQRDGLIALLSTLAARDAAELQDGATRGQPTARDKAEPPVDASDASQPNAYPGDTAAP